MTPQGEGWVAPGGRDGTVLLWDAASGKQLPNPTREESVIAHSVRFTGDSTVIAAGLGAGIRVEYQLFWWDAFAEQAVGPPVGVVPGVVWSLAVSPDGTLLAVGGTGDAGRTDSEPTVLLTDRSGKLVRSLSHKVSAYAVEFSRDGRTLAVATGDGLVELWDVETGAKTREFPAHSGGASALAYSPDGRTLATAGQDGAIALWDTESWALVGRIAAHARSPATRSATWSA